MLNHRASGLPVLPLVCSGYMRAGLQSSARKASGFFRTASFFEMWKLA